MNLDFLLIVICYLAVVLFLHYYIKNNEIGSYRMEERVPRNILKKRVTKEYTEETISLDNNESENNISMDESQNNSTHEDNDYLKYLDNPSSSDSKLEPFDEQLYNKHSADLFKEQQLGSELDRYFSNNVGSNDQPYSFEPVPTVENCNLKESEKPSLSCSDDSLYANQTPLNKENQFDGVSAFDEFGVSQFSSQFASIM